MANKLVRAKWILTITIVLSTMLGLIIGIGLVRWVFRDKSPVTAPHVVYDGEDSKPMGERLFRVAKGAKSAVCEDLTRREVEKVIDRKTNGAQVSIPTSKQGNQTVSACTYVVADSAKSDTNIRTVIVTQRVYADVNAAMYNFETLTKEHTNDSRQLSDKIIYNNRASQLVAQKGVALITVVVLRADPSKEVDQSVFTRILNAM